MALEKRWVQVSPQLLNSNGTTDGILQVPNSLLFHVKQQIILRSNTQPTIFLQINRITTLTHIEVGPQGGTIFDRTNVSAYLTADSAAVNALEQLRPTIAPEDIFRAIFEEEPTVAVRSSLVDPLGERIDSVTGLDGRKRLAVDAQVSLGSVELELDALTPPTKPDPSNVLIAGSEDGSAGGLKHAARVDSELDLRVGISDGANKAEVDLDGNLHVKDPGIPDSVGPKTAAESLSITFATDIPPIDVEVEEPLQISGTEDGTPSGVERGLVYNRRQQILAAHDRNEDYTFLDPGTKNERIGQIDYTSPTFLGITVSRVFTYNLIGNRYVLDTSVWSVT
jgi:hypothetical protein